MVIKASEIGKLLVERNMLRFGDFLLTSGKASSIYVDLRQLPSFPEEFKLLAGELSINISEKDAGICGVAVGGLPLATAVAMILLRPLVYVRKEKKEHGTMSRLEGVVDRSEYIVIDDVATTGGSLLRAVKAVREKGAEVRDAWVVVDRIQGAKESLGEEGVNLNSLATLPDIVRSIYNDLSKKEKIYASMYLKEVRY